MTQEVADGLEAEAIARYRAFQVAFGACWGVRGRSLVVRRRAAAKPTISPRAPRRGE